MPEGSETEWRLSAHEEMASLNARQTAADENIRGLRVEVRSVTTSLERLSERIQAQISTISAGTATDWKSFWTAGAGIGTVAIMLAGAVIAPIISSVTAVGVAVTEETKARIATEDKEADARLVSQRRIYDEMEKNVDKAWSKDAHVEFEKRIDERNSLEQSYNSKELARIDAAIALIQANYVPFRDHEQRWAEERASREVIVGALTNSINRVTEHLNKTDERLDAKVGDIDKVIHGYGIADELRDLQTLQRNNSDKLFELISRLGSLGVGVGGQPPAAPGK